MSRVAFGSGLFALVALVACLTPRVDAVAWASATPEEITTDRLIEVLQAKQAKFEEIPADPLTKFQNILNVISNKFSRPNENPPFFLTFEINLQAFKDAGFSEEKVTEYAPVAQRPLPEMRNVSLGVFVHKILDRVTVRSGATYILRRDRVEITTNDALRKEIWRGREGPYLPLVHGHFESKPLAAALRGLVEQSDYGIVIDPRVEQTAKTRVSARFLSTPLDTALETIANTADLQPVLRDNVFYVTTRENARRIKAEQEKTRSAETEPKRIEKQVE
jgi:hypothetical protein